MAFDYRQVSDLYRTLKSAGVVQDDLPSWSSEMNRLSGTDLYSAGLHDNWVKQASTGLDRIIESTGLPDLTGRFGRSVGSLVGDPAAGQRIGQSLPRMAVNFAPMFIPAVGPALALGATGALSGAETYTATNSPAAGLLAAATNVAMPGVANLAEQFALRKLGGTLLKGPVTDAAGQVSQLSRYAPTNLFQGLGSQFAGQSAAAAFGEASGFGQDALAGQPLHNPFSTETLLNLTLGQLPFAGLYATKAGRAALGGETSKNYIKSTQENIAKTQATQQFAEAQRLLAERLPIEKVPNAEPITPTVRVAAETQYQLQKLRGEIRSLPPTPENVVLMQKLQRQEESLMAETEFDPQATAGVRIVAETPRQDVHGIEVFHNPATGYRLIQPVGPDGKPDLTQDLIGYSTLNEPASVEAPLPGVRRFSVPDGFYTRAKRTARTESRMQRLLGDPNQPELPVGPENDPGFDHVAALREADTEVDLAKNETDKQAAIVKLNGVRAAYGIPPLNDGLTLKRMKISNIDQKAALKAEIAKTVRDIVVRLSPEQSAARRDKDDLAKAVFQAKGGDIGLPDLDKDTMPLYDLIDPYTSNVVTSLGEEPYKRWLASSKSGQKTSWPLEAERYKVFFKLRALGDIGKDATLSKDEATVFNEELAAQGIGVDNVADLVDFPSRPYVLEANQGMIEQVQRLKDQNSLPSKALSEEAQTIPAGGDFIWGLENYDPVTNRMGKHSLPRTGILRVSQFKNMAGRGKPLPDAEIELAKVIVPEAFDSDGNVDVRKLYAVLETKGPVVEVKKLGGEGSQRELDVQLAEAIHNADTALPNWNELTFDQIDALPDSQREVIDRAIMLRRQRGEGRQLVTGSRYSFLGPKSEQDMPGYVEGLVRVPLGNEVDDFQGTKVNVETGRKYTGPHFGSEDTNVLAFFRGYEEIVDGKKVFHVIEVQSDWGQQARKAEEYKRQTQETIARGGPNAEIERRFTETHPSQFQSHPLLRVYETLALKAAIAHARSVGAEGVLVSDAETAMMTEGHDRATEQIYKVKLPDGSDKFFYSGDEARQFVREGKGTDFQVVQKVKQEQGMRLHYDTTLPSAMSKLTGEKGERVGVGEHKQARTGERDDMGFPQSDRLTGSPVFREPSGEPKSSITGRLYPLSKIPTNRKFTLTDPSKMLGETADGESRPFLPTTPEDVALVRDLVGDGTGLHQATRLSKSSNPFYAELGRLALAHPEMLARVEASVWSLPGTSRTFNNWQTKKTRIQLSDALLMADPESVDHTTAHELFHALTKSELNDPANEEMLNKFDALRRHLIKNLPEDMKTALEKALANDWMRRFVNDQATVEELHPKATSRSVLYGLLNMDEFASQSFTSPSLRKFMQSVKSEKKVTAWGKFTGLVKQLLKMGESVSDTAFGDFLAAVDPILKQGEYVASLKNFTERYLEGQGLAEADVATQSRKVMDLVIDAKAGTSDVRLFDRLLSRPWAKSSAVQLAERKVNTFFQSQSDDALGAAGVLKEMGLTQNKNGLDELVDAAVNGENVADALDLLPQQAAQYVYAKVEDLRTTLDALRAATSSKNDGLTNITNPQFLRGPVKDALASLDRILESERVQDEAMATIQSMLSVAPDAFFDRYASKSLGDVQDQNDPKRGSFLGERLGGNAVQRFLEQPAQIARSNPKFAEWMSKAFMLGARIRNQANASLLIFGRPIGEDGRVGEQNTSAEVTRTTKALANTKMVNALNRWIWLNQKKGAGEVRMLPDTDHDVAKALAGLTPAERTEASNLMAKLGVSKVAADQQSLAALHDISVSLGSRIVMRDGGLKLDQAVPVVDELLSAAMVDWTSPQQAAVANAKIAAVQAKLPPEPFLHLLRFVQGEAQKQNLYREYLSKNPLWVSAQRGGKFLFEYTKNGKTVLAGANSRKEAEHKAEGRPIRNFRATDKNETPTIGPDSVEIIGRLRQLETNQLEMLRGLGIDVADLQEIQRTSPIAQFEREIAAGQSVDPLIPPARTLGKGAEELPWFENHLDWIQKNAAYWQRRLLRTQGQTMLLEPEVMNAPETRDLIKTHMDSLLSPDPEAAKVMQKFAVNWAMGFNAATAIANSPQTFMRGASELVAMGAGPVEAFKLVSKTWKDFIGHRVQDKPWNTPEEQKFMADAIHDGQIDATLFDEDAAAQETLATNFKRAMNKGKPQTTGQRLSTLAGAYSTAAMWMFRQGERANNSVSLLAAYRFLKAKHPTWDSAKLKEEAYAFNSSVNDVGGRANRSVGLYSGQGAFPRTAAMMVSAMQSYTLGSTFQLIRYLKNGLFRPEGLTPSQVWSARKAATYMLGTQLAAAGVLGLPFVSGALALLDKAFPELELNRRLRETVSSLFSSDEENGSILSDIAMSGVPSMMGWDFQSRLSQGNILPGVTEYNGFQPEQLLGVPANIVKNFVNGGTRVARGDASGGYAFVPPAIKKLAELVGEQGTVRDFKNRPLFEPTAGEKVGVALGFNPKRLSDFNAAQRMAEQNQDVQSRREGQFRQSLAEQVLRGNFGTVQQELRSRLQEEPTFDLRQAVQGIARASEELTFPRDLRREGSQGTSKERSRLLSSFGLTPSAATEESRLIFRKGVEAKLGLPSPVSQMELAVTRLMDQLRSQDPTATRSELRRAAETALRRTSPAQPVLQ